mmetsp:Transcript_27550/g.84490  ORF Transcript_27550/g.84490 Transcript_27550/m.84490 type:complete len:230 (-) Transcript_27550:141-830(-)
MVVFSERTTVWRARFVTVAIGKKSPSVKKQADSNRGTAVKPRRCGGRRATVIQRRDEPSSSSSEKRKAWASARDVRPKESVVRSQSCAAKTRAATAAAPASMRPTTALLQRMSTRVTRSPEDRKTSLSKRPFLSPSNLAVRAMTYSAANNGKKKPRRPTPVVTKHQRRRMRRAGSCSKIWTMPPKTAASDAVAKQPKCAASKSHDRRPAARVAPHTVHDESFTDSSPTS